MIPAFLRRQRNQRRLTLENLSAKVGMSPQHLSEIESGKRDPRERTEQRPGVYLALTCPCLCSYSTSLCDMLNLAYQVWQTCLACAIGWQMPRQCIDKAAVG